MGALRVTQSPCTLSPQRYDGGCLVMRGSEVHIGTIKMIILQQPCMERASGAVHTYAFSDLHNEILL